MRAGMAVAADDGHARLGKSEFGADDVHDALVGRIHVEQRDAKFLAILLQRLNLERCNGIGDGSAPRFGRNIVVNRGHGAVGLAHPASGRAQAVEGLRRGDLVDQVQVYVEKRQAVGRRRDYVLVPDFLE